MRLSGRIFKSGKYWAVEVPILGVITQGRTRKEAFEMIADAIESLVNKSGFRIKVYPGKEDYFEINSNDFPSLSAFLLRRLRLKSGLTLEEVAKRLGVKSHNTYARYEQGVSSPTIEKFNELFSAVSPDHDFVVMESKDRYQK